MSDEDKQLNTEAQILAAAVAIFQRDGFDGARMQDIADTAKINKALLHYYYRSKEKLFQAVFGLLFKQVVADMMNVLNSDTPLFDKIYAFYDKHITFLLKNPYLPGFIMGEINRNPQLIVDMLKSNNVESMFNGFVTQVRKEITEGKIRDIDPLQIFVNMLALSVFPFGARGLLMGLFNLKKEDFEVFVETRKKLCAEMLINSIKL